MASRHAKSIRIQSLNLGFGNHDHWWDTELEFDAMTIHHAGPSKPKVPSHRVEFGRDSLVLIGRHDAVIYDDDVRSIRSQTFTRRQPNYRRVLGEPKVGYRLTTLVHGADNTKTKIRLRWKMGEADRLDDYRLRVAKRIANGLLEKTLRRQDVGQNDWKIEEGWLCWNDGRSIQLDQVTDIRYFGDDAAVWTGDSTTPVSLAADSPDQLILTELLQHYARENSADAVKATPLGKLLFTVRHEWRVVVSQLWYRMKSSPTPPVLIAIGVIAIFFSVVTLVGAVISLRGLPGRDDWARIPPLPLPFIAMFVIGAIPLTFRFVSDLARELWRDRELDVYERGLVIRGLRSNEIRFDQIVDFGITSKAIYRELNYAYTAHHLHLAIVNKNGHVVWREFQWDDSLVSRGEITFLSDLLKVVTKSVLDHQHMTKR